MDLVSELRPYSSLAFWVAITLVLTWLVATLVSWLIARLMVESSPHATGGARRLGMVIVWLIGGTLVAQEVGLSPAILLVVIALFGVAALIAVLEPLGNYGAKYFTDIYTPFKVGDVIEIQAYSGKVIEINAITTILLAENERIISVPNSLFIREVVVNHSPFAWKEINIPISVGGSADLAGIESELLRSLTKMRARLDARFPPVLTTKARSAQASDLVLTLMLRRPEERDTVTAEANRRIAEVLARPRTTRP